MARKLIRGTIALAGLVLWLTTMAEARVDFVHEIMPILKENCAKCHTNGKYKAGLSMDTREALLESETVVVGRASDSLFIEVLTAEDEDERMPHDADPLPPAEIALLAKWVDEGLPWEQGFTFRQDRWEAPLEPRRPELPPAAVEGENPVDRLVRAYFEENRIKAPAEISDAAFLRRVSLDLVGLLPAIEELDRFLESDDPGKREAKIRELLGREIDYADHWMTFWSDLLRNDYAGTGFIDGGRKQITGWLYRALRENMPYDQFVRELLNPTPESEGFIKGIKWRGNVNASQVPEIQFAQNVSQVFFGENMKCASCHDSFIDDWKLEDAYGMAAIIAGEPLEMYRCDKPTGEKMDAKFLFDSLGSIDTAASREERLQRAAELSTSPDNGRLTRTIVNRLWSRLMGRGLVEPVDMMSNRPWSEDLLDFLAWDLAEHGYDLKRTLFLITSSRAYQSETVTSPPPNQDYLFAGPLAKRMTAEQFIDAVWGITGTAPAAIEAKVDRGVAQASATLPGQWIWSASGNRPAGETVVFEKKLNLPTLRAAKMVLTCDNEYELTINGTEVGGDRDWETVEVYDLRQVLREGENLVRVKTQNGGQEPNAAAFYGWIDIESEEGLQRFATDGTWLANGEPAVVIQGGPWAARLGPTFAAHLPNEAVDESTMSRAVRASLVKSTLLMRALGRPNREQVVTSRPAELTTLQALELNNGAEFVDYLKRGAARLDSFDGDLVDEIYRAALGRPPSDLEAQVAREILRDSPTREDIADLLWSVLMLPEFQLIK